MRRLRRWLMAVLLLGSTLRHARRRRREERERIVAAGDADPAAELVVVALLLLVAAGAAFFVVAYAVGWSTQVLGGALGGTLALLALALGVIAQRLVVEEEIEEDYPQLERPEDQAALVAIVHESGSRITRKRLLGAAGGLAGAALGAAFVAPAVSLGPLFDTSRLNSTPWRRGRRLVDKDGKPWSADQIGTGAFYTAYPEGADKDAIASPLILVRLDPAELELPPERRAWAPEGILAYSKICTHAGCAIALYRNPLFDRVEPGHALVCPCHYSTFDPSTGGTVLFGPAGRPLPQLPLSIANDRTLRAAGNFSGPVGPGWWGVRSAPNSQ